MNYEKPCVVLIASAVDTIKGQTKGDDLPESPIQASVTAYEADE
jgi:hypothetical protein